MTGLVGVALAGGGSRRLGLDKAALRIERTGGERSLLAWAVERLGTVCDEVVVAAGARGARVGGVGLAVADAPPPAAGPAAGLLGAAGARPGASLLALACDLPLVPVALLERLARERGRHPDVAWIVPVRDGRLEPLCAVYAPAALAALALRAAAGHNALHGLAAVASVTRRELPVEGIDELAGEAEPLLNLNTPDDLERFRRLERDRRG
jgi:molybdopterin-guanine dinucleotide biosynthesis protein A